MRTAAKSALVPLHRSWPLCGTSSSACYASPAGPTSPRHCDITPPTTDARSRSSRPDQRLCRGPAGHTYAFDETAAWLVTHCSKSAVRDLLRIAWRTVGSIVTRVVADAEASTD